MRKAPDFIFFLTNLDYCDSIDYRSSTEVSMNNKIFDSELKIMEIIWANEPISAKDVSIIAASTLEWNKNTTYTVIKKLEAKGFIKRTDPAFVCTSLISRNEVCKSEAHGLLDRLFGGSRGALFSALIENEKLTKEEIEELRRLIDKV